MEGSLRLHQMWESHCRRSHVSVIQSPLNLIEINFSIEQEIRSNCVMLIWGMEQKFVDNNFLMRHFACWYFLIFVRMTMLLLLHDYSGSMEPAFHRGDILFLSRNQERSLKTGDIVVYKLNNKDIPIVHRVTRNHEKYVVELLLLLLFNGWAFCLFVGKELQLLSFCLTILLLFCFNFRVVMSMMPTCWQRVITMHGMIATASITRIWNGWERSTLSERSRAFCPMSVWWPSSWTIIPGWSLQSLASSVCSSSLKRNKTNTPVVPWISKKKLLCSVVRLLVDDLSFPDFRGESRRKQSDKYRKFNCTGEQTKQRKSNKTKNCHVKISLFVVTDHERFHSNTTTPPSSSTSIIPST